MAPSSSDVEAPLPQRQPSASVGAGDGVSGAVDEAGTAAVAAAPSSSSSSSPTLSSWIRANGRTCYNVALLGLGWTCAAAGMFT